MYRIGNEEIEAVRRVIESKELFKVNRGTLQETQNAERELCEMMGIPKDNIFKKIKTVCKIAQNSR